jgi:BirA family biotin operon repressor/biotin-[acetyl-CoA-carboxylase] ligase
LYDSLEKWYKKYSSEGFGPVRDEWIKKSGIIGKNIRVVLRDRVQTGKAIGIDHYGALLVFDEKEKTKRLIEGDVSLVER